MEDYSAYIKDSRFFEGIDAPGAEKLMSCVGASTVHAKTGEYLIRAAYTPATVMMVLSGNLAVFEEDYWGNRNLIGMFQAGDIMGDPSIEGQENILNISAIAMEDSVLLKLDINRLMDTCAVPCPAHQQFIKNFMQYLTLRVSFLKTKISHLSRRSIREKLLWYLYTESLRQGSRDFTIPYNRQQLADYLCVDRAAMSTELGKLQKEGLLSTQRSHFTLFIETPPRTGNLSSE